MTVLTWRLRVDEIGGGKDVIFRAPDASLVPLAQAIGVDRVLAGEAHLRVRPVRDGAFEATGTVKARLVQTCVVTLESFESDIVEPIAVRFAAGPAENAGSTVRAETEDGEEGSSGMAELPEPIVDGALDLGVIVQEFLALAVDPYPRKPGVSFEPPAPEEPPPSPFAALARLRSRDDGAGGA